MQFMSSLQQEAYNYIKANVSTTDFQNKLKTYIETICIQKLNYQKNLEYPELLCVKHYNV